jgi:hypothetical protein
MSDPDQAAATDKQTAIQSSNAPKIPTPRGLSDPWHCSRAVSFSSEMTFSKASETLFQQDSNGFDFNLKFEQLFFTIVPSSLFLAASCWRTLSLARRPQIVQALIFRNIKLVSSDFSSYCLC